MSIESLSTHSPRGFSSSGVRWIEVLQTHDELSIIFPDKPDDPVKVADKYAAKTLIRHWVRETGHMGASKVRVMWPKTHQELWAVDI